MPSRFLTPLLLALALTGAGFGQTALPTSRIYILLKPSLAEPGPARDAFAQRMAALGVVNLQFVSAAAARCDAPVSAQPAIGVDADVAGVLPADATPAATAPPVSAALPATAMGTPPYVPQQSMPIGAGMQMGGMGGGIAMLTEIAGNLMMKFLTPGASCKIHLADAAPVIPAAGGTGAFEVKASGSCAWQAVSTVEWLQVKAEVNSAGTVSVVFSATPGPALRRQAVVLIQPVSGMPPLKGRTVVVVAQR